MLISRDEAEKILTPYQNIFAECITLSCNDYFSLLGTFPHTIKSRTTYNIIYDFIESHARSKFDGLDGIKLFSRDGLFIIIVRDQLAIRFKKFNSDKMPSNIPTQQTIDYMTQQFDLPGIPAHTSLIVGYELDPFQSSLHEITITCPNGSKNLWSFNVNKDGSSKADILELPLRESSEPVIPIRIRKDKRKEDRKVANE